MNERNGYEIIRLDSVGSTNDYAKAKRSEGKNLLVIAKSQTGGRGTKGRSFSSQTGGVYLSALTFYEDFPAKRAFEVMQHAAAAVCETLSSFSLAPTIKWPNDIFVGGKKICGILIENSFTGNSLRSTVVGIGLNICNALPKELKDIATTVALELGKEVDFDEVESVLLEKLTGKSLASSYARYLGWIGERVKLLVADKEIHATIIGVNEQGELLAQTEKGVEKFAAAEVSVRF